MNGRQSNAHPRCQLCRAAIALYLAGINVPPELYSNRALGFDMEPIFAQKDIVRLR